MMHCLLFFIFIIPIIDRARETNSILSIPDFTIIIVIIEVSSTFYDITQMHSFYKPMQNQMGPKTKYC